MSPISGFSVEHWHFVEFLVSYCLLFPFNFSKLSSARGNGRLVDPLVFPRGVSGLSVNICSVFRKVHLTSTSPAQ
ncbi:hypothetical protein GDO78_012269 [Eleutherodactylus coqui]|uniref:Uncharacterized protein n=1 Tax=Eleutherodactylus coqui TaxID=57060 RepID=A0A8J6F436_ELECQ|nr:hypothetical protein GDO78_012269 [Eleutherodactylus coqui]